MDKNKEVSDEEKIFLYKASLCLLMMSVARFEVGVKRSKLVPIGWTIDPEIRFTHRGRKYLREVIVGVLDKLRISYTEPKDHEIVVGRIMDVLKIKDAIDVVESSEYRFLPSMYSRQLKSFFKIAKLYHEGKHTEIEVFLAILDERTSFMANAVSKDEFVAKNNIKI